MSAFKYSGVAVLAAAACLASAAPEAMAQNEQVWNNPGVGDWNTGSNWMPFAFPPDISVEEIGVINNGGTAFLSSAAVTSAGGVIVGRGTDVTGGGGTLEIRTGGSLILDQNNTVGGQAIVGVGRTGTLRVQPGGSLTAKYFQVMNTATVGQSSVVLGGTTPGTTTLAVDHALLEGQTSITGPNVNFTADGLVFGSVHSLTAGITGASHSKIQVGGVAQLGGNLNLQFTGVTPVVGNSWTLLNAGGVSGDFARKVTSNVPLPAGKNFVVSKNIIGNGATNVDVALENVLTLTVNRATGALSIKNVSGAPISFDGYAIHSPSDSLDPTDGVWNSLADQAIGSWEQATAVEDFLSELQPIGSTPVTAAPLSLGNAFTPELPAFGAPVPEDLEFAFRRSDGKSLIGLVEYEGAGIANTFVLTVDPATGNARINNDSETNFDLDGYTISSPSSSLKTTWSSLRDQGDTAWHEASPNASRLSELNPNGTNYVAPDSTIELNGLFNTAGSQDLTFEFRSPTLGKFNGIVVYAPIGGLIGDYNANGIVDAADYTVWRDTLGQNVAPGSGADGSGNGVIDQNDYVQWKSNFGNTSGAASAAASSASVPEPASSLLVLSALLIALVVPRKQKKNYVGSA